MELCYTNNQNDLMKKYSYLVTFLTQHQLFRDYLGLKEPTNLLLPNGFLIVRERSEKNMIVEGVFTPRAPIATKLSRALHAVDLVQHWIQDFKEAQELFIWQLGLWRRPSFVPRLAHILFDTLTVSPAAGAVSPVDGYVGRQSVDEAFSTIRNGAGNTSNTSTATMGDPYLQASTISNQFAHLYRYIGTFDTSPLTASAVISATDFKIKGVSKDSGLGTSVRLDIVSSIPASTSSLANADYGNLGGTSYGYVTYTVFSTTGYNTIALDSNGQANVNKTGISKFGIRIEWDTNNNFTGTWAASARTGMVHNTGDSAGNEPQLVVTYTIPAANEELYGMLASIQQMAFHKTSKVVSF